MKLTDFRTDPEVYMDKWEKERGYSEEMRDPEDHALPFFRNHVIPDIKAARERAIKAMASRMHG